MISALKRYPALVLQEASVQPVADVALRHAVEAAALRQLYRHVILRVFRWLLVDDRLQRAMVDHIMAVPYRIGDVQVA